MSVPNATATRSGADSRLAPAALLEHASAIADEIRGHTVRLRDGSITWLAPDPPSGQGPTALTPQLYEGTSGVAIFLAAIDHERGAPRDDASLARRAVAPLEAMLRRLVDDPERAAGVRMPIGGLVGLGSFIYTFVRLGAWLDDAALIETAHRASCLLTPERLQDDRNLDFMSGCAGGLLAMLALEDVVPEPNRDGATPRDLAVACAARLLEARRAWDGRPRAWSGVDRPPLSGFAHGACGISHALLRLYARNGDESLLRAAFEGFAYESSLYDRAHRNWLDPRFDRLLEQSAWCHGAPGIALGRLGALEWVDDPSLDDGIRDAFHRDLDDALALTLALPDAPVDHLCCGTMGFAEVSLVAATSLARSNRQSAGLRPSDFADDANVRAARVVGRAMEAGAYSVRPPDAPPAFDPCLFRGHAGVGYQLLRLAAPERIPCLLTMQ